MGHVLSQAAGTDSRSPAADRGALEFARSRGAPAVEAYPLDGAVSPSAPSTGYASTLPPPFAEVARRPPERPIMQNTLGAGGHANDDTLEQMFEFVRADL